MIDIRATTLQDMKSIDFDPKLHQIEDREHAFLLAKSRDNPFTLFVDDKPVLIVGISPKWNDPNTYWVYFILDRNIKKYTKTVLRFTKHLSELYKDSSMLALLDPKYKETITFAEHFGFKLSKQPALPGYVLYERR